MFLTYTAYRPTMKKVKGYNGVTLFASRYGSVRLIRQLPDEKTEMIILQEVVHLTGSFNVISQSQIMDTDVKVKPVNHYSLNLYSCHRKVIATAPLVDGFLVLDRVLDRARESTEYIDIDSNINCLPALKTTGHASRYDSEKRMQCLHCSACLGQLELEIFPTITDAPRITPK